MSEDKNLFERNMELWERWTNSYLDTMTKAMDKTMEQSVTLRGQAEKVATVALQTQFEATLAGLKALEKQVEILSAKMDELLKKQG
jgi:hypothetical protein